MESREENFYRNFLEFWFHPDWNENPEWYWASLAGLMDHYCGSGYQGSRQFGSWAYQAREGLYALHTLMLCWRQGGWASAYQEGQCRIALEILGYEVPLESQLSRLNRAFLDIIRRFEIE